MTINAYSIIGLILCVSLAIMTLLVYSDGLYGLFAGYIVGCIHLLLSYLMVRRISGETHGVFLRIISKLRFVITIFLLYTTLKILNLDVIGVLMGVTVFMVIVPIFYGVYATRGDD